tara:strand:- start:54 stop:359 length:306 start_codon:yes stop_codon:yes gene_type:complete
MAQKTKNKKINIGGQKYKIHEDVYKYLENIANVLQMHEIAMLGWAKNCYKGTDEKYIEEFHSYIMSIPHAEKTINQMIEVDKKMEEEKQKETAKKEEEVKE